MSDLTAFLQANIIPIYFIYGLAHFVTGLAVALESGRATQLRLSRALPFLALFGITHGITEWIEMFSMIATQIPTLAREPEWATMIKLGWKALSFVFLFEFGARLLSQFTPEHKRWLRWLPALGVVLYLAGALRMFAQSLPSMPFPALVAMWTNYALGVPASILAVAAMLAQRRAFVRDNMPQFGRDLVGAALALGWYSLLDQVIDDPTPYFPTNILNADAFMHALGLPVEILRTLAVSALAFFVIRMLRVFEVEYARRLEAANRARFAAQEEATRELLVMFETCRILGTSLDVNQLINDSLTKIVTLLDPMVAGSVYLREPRQRALVLRACKMRPEQPSLSPIEVEHEKRAAQDAFETSSIAYAAEPKSGTSFVAVPLVSQGQTSGALCLAHRAAFSNYAVIHTLARQLGIALENARLYSEVQEKEQLRGQLLERAVAAQEEERKRIARELHDETGQSLSALIMGMGAAREALAADPERTEAILDDALPQTNYALAEIRKLILDLRPTVLDDLGLVPALRRYTQDLAERTGMGVRLGIDGLKDRLPPQVETLLFRTVQEALTNVRKHATARQVTIFLSLKANRVTAVVEDDGQGFDVQVVLASPERGRGLGLAGMRERAALLGGTVTVESQPGRGTKVVAEVPLE